MYICVNLKPELNDEWDVALEKRDSTTLKSLRIRNF